MKYKKSIFNCVLVLLCCYFCCFFFFFFVCLFVCFFCFFPFLFFLPFFFLFPRIWSWAISCVSAWPFFTTAGFAGSCRCVSSIGGDITLEHTAAKMVRPALSSWSSSVRQAGIGLLGTTKEALCPCNIWAQKEADETKYKKKRKKKKNPPPETQ